MEVFLAELKDNGLEKIEHREPNFIVHDFRKVFSEKEFDLLINIKAFQGIPKASMIKAAETFFKATKSGGVAIFDTQNVQGEGRTIIEDAIVDAGYYIPGNKTERWYRKVLDATGITYAMVLGRPIVPQWGQYDGKGGEEQYQKDKEILLSFDEEYKQRKEAEQSEIEEKLNDGITKIAHFVYNTG